MKLKISGVLSFEPGILQVFGKGYDEKTGSGFFQFDEENIA